MSVAILTLESKLGLKRPRGVFDQIIKDQHCDGIALQGLGKPESRQNHPSPTQLELSHGCAVILKIIHVCAGQNGFPVLGLNAENRRLRPYLPKLPNKWILKWHPVENAQPLARVKAIIVTSQLAVCKLQFIPVEEVVLRSWE